MNKLVFWIVVAAIILGLLTLVSHVLVPFITALIIAYILRPLMDCRCTKYQLPRYLMSSLIFFLFISFFIIVCTLLFPAIYQQTAMLINKIPMYKNYLQTELVPILLEKLNAIDPDIAYKIKSSIDSFLNIVFSIISGVFNNLWGYTVATINIFMLIILVPIILFYFLRDWPNMVNSIEKLLPIKNKSKILEIFIDINKLLSAYIRGQLNICLILACYYSVVLTLIGVDLSLLLGALSGFLIIIPFIGTILSFSLSMITCYFTFGFSSKVLYVMIAYGFGYLMESYVLSPKIIGDRIGLHPVWIIFSVFTGASLFGFVGLFFAIPLAGVIKVLLHHTLGWYRSSSYYKQ